METGREPPEKADGPSAHSGAQGCEGEAEPEYRHSLPHRAVFPHHQNRRLTRKTIAHSRLWENHCAANSVQCWMYNFTRKHETLDGRTPAQAMNLADHRWSLDEVIAMVDCFHKAKQDATFAAAFAGGNFVDMGTGEAENPVVSGPAQRRQVLPGGGTEG